VKRVSWALAAALMLCLASSVSSLAASSLGSECKTGFDEVRPQIKAMSDPTKKQQAQKLAMGAYTNMKSGEYQDCLDKLKQIKTLLQ
jgi:hypothetical protein